MLARRGYGAAIDAWALGVLLYELLAGRTPFASSRTEDTYDRIIGFVASALRFPPKVSSGARDLVHRLLVVEPSSRASPGEALGSEWLRTAGS